MKQWAKVLLAMSLMVLRAGLVAQTLLTARLDGSQENPPQTTSGTGSAWAVLSADMNSLTFRVTFASLNKPATAAHFHAGGSGGGVVVHPITLNGNTAAGTWTNLPDSIVAHLMSGEIYLNVHTSSSPGGEIRGFLHPASGAGFTISMDASQEPGQIASGAQGTGYAVLDSTQTNLTFGITIAGLSAALTGAHFHVSPSGSVVHPISFTDSTSEGTWTGLSASNQTALAAGNLYANVHSSNYPGGEIRGTLLPVGAVKPTGVEGILPSTPASFRLEQNYPNPFNPSTTIRFQLAKEGPVALKVYDLMGREVATLLEGRREPGTYEVSFDARSLSSGVYLYRLSAGGAPIQTRKLTVLK